MFPQGLVQIPGEEDRCHRVLTGHVWVFGSIRGPLRYFRIAGRCLDSGGPLLGGTFWLR